jgi:hypothetical protein
MLLRGALSIHLVVIVACMVSTATIVLAEPVIFQVGTQQTAVTGTTAVRYGANGLFVVKTLTDSTACTNEVFGDPAPDVAKSCFH